MLDTKTETFEPFNDDTEIEVEKKPLSRLNAASRMPDGFVDRLDNNDDLEIEDYAYMKWAVNNHTNQNFSDYLDSGEEGDGIKLGYIINLVFRFIQDEKPPSWEEFQKRAGNSFMSSGTLGVQR